MDFILDTIINRYNTNSMKWDFTEQIFGEKDLLAIWVADIDFRHPGQSGMLC